MEEVENLHKKIKEVYGELESTQAELHSCLQKLAKLKKKYKDETSLTSSLRQELKQLRHKVHKYKSMCRKDRKSRDDVYNVSTQTEDIRDAPESASTGEEPQETTTEQSTASSSHQEAENKESEPLSIADSLKAAAEEAMQQTGYTYDERTGLYYDHNSGYYYDSERSLYYEPNSGTYLYFDSESQSYQFHSQVDPAELAQYNAAWSKEKVKRRRRPRAPPRSASPPPPARDNTDRAGPEDRETHSQDKPDKPSKKPRKRKNSASESRDEGQEEKMDTGKNGVADVKDDEDGEDGEESELEEGEVTSSSEEEVEMEEEEDLSTVHYPPCIRAIVTESTCLDVGTLFIVTCTGATIGREKDLGHLIHLQDNEVSKMHCDIKYDDDLKRYVIKDHASQNGTFINNNRLSETKTLSEPCPLQNGFDLKVGGTVFSLHIHAGSDTCDDCEPGQVQAKLLAEQAQQPQAEVPVQTKEEKEQQRRRQLKMIKKKFGLADVDYTENPEGTNQTGYKDRSIIRRKTKGSDNPYIPDDAPASVNRAISTENKGHKLLAKMGWKEGEGLGKAQQGISEPVQVHIRSAASAGLGSSRNTACSLDNPRSTKAANILAKTRERYQQLDTTSLGSTSTVTEGQTQKSGVTHTAIGKITWHKGQTINHVKDTPRVNLGGDSEEEGEESAS